MACALVPEETAGAEGCQVLVPEEIDFKKLAPELARKLGVEIEPAILAKVNGRDYESAIVSPKRMKILLVPKN
jgi:hypothetical protein